VHASRWDGLPARKRNEICQRIAGSFEGMTFAGVELREHALDKGRTLRHAVGYFEYDGTTLVLIPGGKIALGIADPIRDTLVHALPPAAFARFESAGVIDNFVDDPVAAGALFTPYRVVTLAPFLIEETATRFEELSPSISEQVHRECTIQGNVHECVVDDEVAAILELACPRPWRLPTLDEWQHAYSANTRTFFPWGIAWPGTSACPIEREWSNAYGLDIELETEVTAFSSVLAGGDSSGWNLNGFDGGIARATAYVTHPSHVDHSRWELYAAAGVRCVIPLGKERRARCFRATPRSAVSR